MSASKWTITNGVKYQNAEEENDITYEYQTEEDVKKTTKNEIYFPNYIVEKTDGEVKIKKRRIS